MCWPSSAHALPGYVPVTCPRMSDVCLSSGQKFQVTGRERILLPKQLVMCCWATTSCRGPGPSQASVWGPPSSHLGLRHGHARTGGRQGQPCFLDSQWHVVSLKSPQEEAPPGLPGHTGHRWSLRRVGHAIPIGYLLATPTALGFLCLLQQHAACVLPSGHVSFHLPDAAAGTSGRPAPSLQLTSPEAVLTDISAGNGEVWDQRPSLPPSSLLSSQPPALALLTAVCPSSVGLLSPWS